MNIRVLAIGLVLVGLFLIGPVLVGMSAPRASAGETPTPAQVREAVTRSLPFLEREGVAWMRGKMCSTCHQIPSLVWSMNEARRHKLPVDAAKVDLWNAWFADSVLKRSVFYQLSDASFSKLREAGLPESDLTKLDALKNKNYVFEHDFRDAAAEKLTKEVAAKHQPALFKVAALPGKGGGGGGENNQYTALLVSGVAAHVKDAAAVQRTLVEKLVKSQDKDGSWPAAGQFHAQQRPKAETIEVATQWTVFGLASVPELSDDGGKALAKGRDFLKQAKPGVSVEELMLRAMLAQQAGDTAASQSLRGDLLKLQHADGGWGWLKDRPASDPFTTGMVLYGLSYLGLDGTNSAVQHAWQYLLKTQDKDGIWPISLKVVSGQKKDNTTNGDAIYTYWSTGWSAIGLLSTLPN